MTKIAIIEDDPVISQMYRMKFVSEGFTVETAENGIVGIELAKDMKPDIILLDLKMPEMPGDEALEKIRSEPWGQSIPVIILTNLGEEEAPKKLVHLNVNSYIVKADMTPREVVSHVKKVLEDLKSNHSLAA